MGSCIALRGHRFREKTSKDTIILTSTTLSRREASVDLTIRISILPLHDLRLTLPRRLLHLLGGRLSILTLDLDGLLATLLGRGLGRTILVAVDSSDVASLGGELLLDDGPGVGGGTRVGEAGEGGELVVVDLWVMVSA